MSKVESASWGLYRVALLGMLLVASGESYAQNWAQTERDARTRLKQAEEIVKTYPQDSATYRDAKASLQTLRNSVQYAMDGHNRALRDRPREATYSRPQGSGHANYGANGYGYDEGLGRPTTSSPVAPVATAPADPLASRYLEDSGSQKFAPFAVQSEPSKAVGMLRLSVSSLSDDYIQHIFPEDYEKRPEQLKTNSDLLARELMRLENKLSDKDMSDEARAKVVDDFKERNKSWYGRYEQAVAARELVAARNGLVNRPEGSRLKRLSAKEALGLVSTVDKNLERGLKLASDKSNGHKFLMKLGFLNGGAKGAGLVGVVGAVAGAVVSGAVVAGEAQEVAKEDDVPATFSRSEFRPSAPRRTSR